MVAKMLYSAPLSLANDGCIFPECVGWFSDRWYLPAANTTLGERLTSDAYASEVIKRYF